jgi:ATP-dependent Clp protease ATP-binding subunit ClpC
MDAAPARTLYRYFLPADTFVRIRLCDPAAWELRARPGLNGSSYRQLVIRTCCPEFQGNLEAALERVAPLDPQAAEELLYQLCVEVNPHLDIHTVRLVERTTAAPGPRPTRKTSSGAEAETARERLAERLAGLGERLRRRIVGQDEALERTVALVRRVASGLSEGRRPLGSLMLLGRTGTGKTELARALAAELFARPEDGPEGGLVRVDCSEYALSHEYAKLIGAPPGYIGHDQGGVLTEALKSRPECVVLFDEVEKAHPRLHSLLLQVLDEGRLADSRGQQADFRRALVVLTSNVGAGELQAASRRLGFAPAAPLPQQALSEIASRALESSFSPEFLGRLDERVLFRELALDDAAAIAAHALQALALRSRKRGLRVAFSPAVARWVAERGFHPDSGAREVRRVIERSIEAPLAELLLAGAGRSRSLVRARVRRGELSFALEE